MSRFDYIIEKIRNADFSEEPFRHVHIENLFSDADFEQIISAPEVRLPPSDDDRQLFDRLFEAGYRIIEFPGCITDREYYLRWHAGRGTLPVRNNSACEGFGMTLRLIEPQTGILREIRDFLSSEEFNRELAQKFGLALEDCNADNGIQKYLDGYEISPHPDIRRKAATFMVNINSSENAEEQRYHTQYMRLKPEYRYINTFWANNPDIDRCWVPWDWCETVKVQTTNNSIVLFSPADDTIHAIKADYNHLPGQRTQLYGNLWYKVDPAIHSVDWEDLDIINHYRVRHEDMGQLARLTGFAKDRIPEGLKEPIKRVLRLGRQDTPPGKLDGVAERKT